MPSHDVQTPGPAPTLQAGNFDAMAANLRDRKRLLKQLGAEYTQVRNEVERLSIELTNFVGRATNG